MMARNSRVVFNEMFQHKVRQSLRKD